RIEHRALLDVQLDERVEVAAHGLRRFRRIEAEGAHGVRERDAVGGPHVRALVRLDAVRDRASAPEVRVEAAALLLADRDAFEDAGRPPVSLQQVDDRLDAGDDAERAVERTAATDRVDVGAGHDRATAARPFDAAPDVADRVAASEETAVLHPTVHELGARDPGRAVERAVKAAARQGAALSELVEPAEEPPLVD